MVIYFLFAIPVLMAIANFFVDYGVFAANLMVVPLLIVFLGLKARSNFALIFSIFLLFSLVFYGVTGDSIRALYLMFDCSAMCVMLGLPAFFFSRVNFSHLKFLRYISIVFVIAYFLMASLREYWFEDRYLGPIRNTNLSAYFLMLSLAFLSVCFPVSSKKSLSVWGVSILLIFVSYMLSGSRSVFFFLPIYLYLFVKSGYLKNFYLLICALPVVLFISTSDLLLGGNERFDSEETSFVTRAAVTEALVDELFETKGFPQGPRYATKFVVELTGNPEMHAHNDLIAGAIDYGFFFLFFVCYFIFLICSRYSLDFWFSFFISLAYMSNALHGYFFGCTLFALFLAVLKQYFISSRK